MKDEYLGTAQQIVSRLRDLGIIQERLRILLDDEIFDGLSKHNPYWDCEPEETAAKLNHVRRKFMWIDEELWSIMSILKDQEE